LRSTEQEDQSRICWVRPNCEDPKAIRAGCALWRRLQVSPTRALRASVLRRAVSSSSALERAVQGKFSAQGRQSSPSAQQPPWQATASVVVITTRRPSIPRFRRLPLKMPPNPSVNATATSYAPGPRGTKAYHVPAALALRWCPRVTSNVRPGGVTGVATRGAVEESIALRRSARLPSPEQPNSPRPMRRFCAGLNWRACPLRRSALGAEKCKRQRALASSASSIAGHNEPAVVIGRSGCTHLSAGRSRLGTPGSPTPAVFTAGTSNRA
jgi:hypothetical protein